MKNVLLVSGDPSGDLHGAGLARALKRADPGLRVAAVGGTMLRVTADEFLFDLASLGVTGFLEPIRKLPIFARLLRLLREHLRTRRPIVVCIDYYGFNRWVLEAAKREGLPTYYYISPQVWASRPGRIRVLKRLVDRMLVIFPFEETFYRKAGVPVSFVGHPLLDHLPEPAPRDPVSSGLRIGLLPGSRAGEVRRHLPVFLDALDLIRKDYPRAVAEVFAAPHLPEQAYAKAPDRGVRIVLGPDYRRRASLDLCLTSSGTATLENALLGVPMVVVYRMSWPTYAIARGLIRVRHISMANLLAEKTLVPELIQHNATPARVARAALDLLAEPLRLHRLRETLKGLRGVLGGPGAASRAARILLEGPGASLPGRAAAPTAGGLGR